MAGNDPGWEVLTADLVLRSTLSSHHLPKFQGLNPIFRSDAGSEGPSVLALVYLLPPGGLSSYLGGKLEAEVLCHSEDSKGKGEILRAHSGVAQPGPLGDTSMATGVGQGRLASGLTSSLRVLSEWLFPQKEVTLWPSLTSL